MFGSHGNKDQWLYLKSFTASQPLYGTYSLYLQPQPVPPFGHYQIPVAVGDIWGTDQLVIETLALMLFQPKMIQYNNNSTAGLSPKHLSLRKLPTMKISTFKKDVFRAQTLSKGPQVLSFFISVSEGYSLTLRLHLLL